MENIIYDTYLIRSDLAMNSMEKYESWLKSPYIDDETKKELKEVKDIKKIEDMFYRDLEFGTGGLRGVIAPGTNRMNVYVIRRTTQGLANYVKKQGESTKIRGVVIAYDSRHRSREFAMEAASIFAGNGIKTYVFDDLRPTPELSYAVRKLSAAAGIVITASHNPPEYNGYKVYWENGAQISPEISSLVLSEIESIDDFCDVQYKNLDTAKDDGLFTIIGSEIDNMYTNDVLSLLINKDLIKKYHDKFKIIYTPLHGTGNKPVMRSLEAAGFKEVYVVKEQEMPDPNFSTVKSPNPEEQSAFDMALKMTDSIKPDIIIGTDPDCDRMGICIANHDNEYKTLTGNQIGALLVEYILSQLKQKNNLPDNGVIVKTIVTSELGKKIAASYGIKTIDTLTGFKYIGEKINEFEESSSYTFLFGYEESNGYLAGTFVRDKDAVIASTLICEAGVYYMDKGISLYDALQNIYKKYGYFDEKLQSITLEGKEGGESIRKIMSNLREAMPHIIGVEEVTEIRDYMDGVGDLPKADVIQLITNNDSIISIRPSGTEPKIKIYYSTSGKNYDDVGSKLSELMKEFTAVIRKMTK